MSLSKQERLKYTGQILLRKLRMYVKLNISAYRFHCLTVEPTVKKFAWVSIMGLTAKNQYMSSAPFVVLLLSHTLFISRVCAEDYGVRYISYTSNESGHSHIYLMMPSARTTAHSQTIRHMIETQRGRQMDVFGVYL